MSAVAEHSQTAPDMAAVISLGVLATCLQGKYKIEGTPGYFEPLSLYTVVIAAPGERKSSVMRDMTTFLYEYEQEYNKAHSMEIRENHLQRESLAVSYTHLDVYKRQSLYFLIKRECRYGNCTLSGKEGQRWRK